MGSEAAPTTTEKPLCAHEHFFAFCEVTRLTDTGTFSLCVTVKCEDCQGPFRFLGTPPGIMLLRPCVNVDGTELTVPIEPEGAKCFFERIPIRMPKIPEKV